VITVLIDVFRRNHIGGWAEGGVGGLPCDPAVAGGADRSDRRARRDAAAQCRAGAGPAARARRQCARTAGGGSAAEIAKATELLDSGAITQEEFEALTAKALA